LARGATRVLAWGSPAAAGEIRRWRARASLIPDQSIRADALGALRLKRAQTDGAALFSILPAARSLSLLRVLVAYQIIWDFLDNVHEHTPGRGVEGAHLFKALVDALDPASTPCGYYLDCPWQDDGGYLGALVETCQENCARLPGNHAVAPLIAQETARLDVLALNHQPNRDKQDASLRTWARREFPEPSDVSWWELSAACSAPFVIYALLALAADAHITPHRLDCVRDAYFPWVAAAATMLDSYADYVEDQASGEHSYVEHYGRWEHAPECVGQLVSRSMSSTERLPDRETHRLIIACMTAMYLTKDAARTPAMRASTSRVARSGGSLTRSLMPVLRIWRSAYGLRAA
jgi:tetraprenyl-beta-curcumene synthase